MDEITEGKEYEMIGDVLVSKQTELRDHHNGDEQQCRGHDGCRQVKMEPVGGAFYKGENEMDEEQHP